MRPYVKSLHLLVVVAILLTSVPLPLRARPTPQPAHSPQPLYSPLTPPDPLASPLATPEAAAETQNPANTDLGWQLLYNAPVVSLFSGAATYNYPLAVPPGRGGLQPQLNLSYNSRRVDGLLGWAQDWTGIGWSVDLMDIAFKRVRQVIGEDQGKPVQFIHLEGGLMLLVNGTAYDLEPETPGARSGRYYAQDAPQLYIERHNELTADPSPANFTGEYWTVRTPDGTEYRLGHNENSEQLMFNVMEGHYGDYRHDVYRWRLDEAHDQYGNSLQVTYEEAQGGPTWNSPLRDTASRLSHIWYNNDGIGGWHSEVIFHSSTFGSQPPTEEEGQPIFGDPGQLDAIEIKHLGQTTRHYTLQYQATDNTDDTRYLQAIQQSGPADVLSFPATTFGYALFNNKSWCADGTSDWELESFVYPRLAHVFNGYGAETIFHYTTPNAWNNHGECTNPFNYYVDTQSTGDSVHGSPATTVYIYTAAYTENFIIAGYADVETLSADYDGTPLRRSQHLFHTESEDFRGREYRTQVYAPEAPGDLLQQVDTHWITLPNGTTTVAHADQVTATTYTPGEPAAVSRVDYTYDVYGNVTQEYDRGNLALSGDERLSTREFYPPAPDNWLIRPQSETTGSRETHYAYDGQPWGVTPLTGTLTGVRQGGGTDWLTTTYAYDGWGNPTVVTDALGHPTTTAYDTQFHLYPVTACNALEQCSHTAYYGVAGIPTDEGLPGQVQQVTAAGGAQSRYTYDDLGRLVAAYGPDPVTGLPGSQADVIYTYPPVVAGQVAAPFAIGAERREQPATWTLYDGLGRALQAQSAAGAGQLVLQTTAYDGLGRTISSSLPVTQTATGGSLLPAGTPYASSTTYDGLGRTATVTAPDGATTRSAYRGRQTLILDAAGHQSSAERDGLGRTLAVTEYTGAYAQPTWDAPGRVTRYWYDTHDALLAVQDAEGHVTRIQYDALGRKTEMWDPSMGHWQYEYDALGNLAQQTDAREQVLTFAYDVLSRLVAKSTGAQVLAQYAYGDSGWALGQRTVMTDATGVTAWDYDARGRVVTATRILTGDLDTYTTGWAYDGAGRVSAITYPTGETVHTIYDARGLVARVYGMDASSLSTYLDSTAYSAAGQPRRQTWGNTLATTYVYRPDNLRLEQLQVQPQAGGAALLDLGYSYDSVGNVQILSDTTRSENTIYTYDERDRLVQATGAVHETYTYSPLGNLATKTAGSAVTYTYGTSYTVALVPPATFTGTYHSYLPLVAHHYTSGPAYPSLPHYATAGQPFAAQILSNGNTYTYDENGNMVTRHVEVSGAWQTYVQEFDAENRLAVITNTTQGSVTHVGYDGDGNRVMQSHGTTTTLYLGDLVEITVAPGKRITRTYYYAGGQRLAMRERTATTDELTYLHGDHLGSASLATDANGAVMSGSETRYTPYGETRTGGSPVAGVTDYAYTGQQLDVATGLYFYHARWYDPALGRFISADTLVPSPSDPQSLNRYAYVQNNPLKYTDPSGHVLEDETEEAERILEGLQGYEIDIVPDWGWRDARGHRYWYPGTWELAHLQSLHQTTIYAHEELYPQYIAGEISSLDFLQSLVDYRAGLGILETFVDDISTLVLGDRGVYGAVKPFLHLTQWPQMNLAPPTGFREYYQDSSNQVRHFWFYVHIAFTTNSARLADSGNWIHENNAWPWSLLNGGGGTSLDRVLGYHGCDLGIALKEGTVDYNEVGNWLVRNLGTNPRTSR